jgi:hypothetical protein
MAGTLGATSDPKDLIPGDADKLGDLETTLNKWSHAFDGIGNGLRDLRIKGWVGQASDAFWPILSKEKSNWHFASDAMAGAAAAVKSYAATLSWAQGQAGTAIDKWKAGDHEAAEHLLSTARKQLQQEAGTLAKKLNDLAGSASDSPDWLVAARSGVDAKKWASDHGVSKSAISPTAWTKEKKKVVTDADSHWRERKKQWGKDADGNWYFRNETGESEDDDGATPGKKAKWSIKLAEWSGSASVWTDGVSGETTADGFTLKGAANVSTLGVDGSAGASITNGQLQVGASGSAYLAQASANGSVDYGVANVQGQGTAFVGPTPRRRRL